MTQKLKNSRRAQQEHEVIRRRERVAVMFDKGMTGADIARAEGVSTATISLDKQAIDAATNERTIETRISHREKLLRKYDRAEKDVQRLLDELLGRLFPTQLGAHGLPTKPNRHDLLEFTETYNRTLDRLLKIYNQTADILHLKSPDIKVEVHDLPPGFTGFLEWAEAQRSNGSRGSSLSELLATADDLEMVN